MLELSKGLYKQTSTEKTPQGGWVEARNIVVGRSLRDISNEEGFTVISDPVDFGGLLSIIIGYITLNKEVVIFSVLPGTGGEGFIGVFDEFNNYATVLRSADLNFSADNPIRGDFIYNFGGDRIITWWDGLDDSANPPRVLNIDCIPFDVNPDGSPVNSDDLILLKLFSELGPLDMTLDSVDDGGGKFKTGAYYIVRAFVHPDGSLTNFSPPSNPIFIHDDLSSNRVQDIDGAEADSISSKSITVTFNNLSSEFNIIRIGIISKIGGVLSAKILPDVKYTTSTKTITLTDEESFFPSSVGILLVPNASYERVHTGVFHENRLHLANVKKIPDLEYQPYANNITVEWVRDQDLALNSYTGSYKDPVFLFDKKGFASNEVYGFVIAFGLVDGTISDWYHIPGPAEGSIGIGAYTDTDLISTINGTNPSNSYSEALVVDPNAKYFQMFNSAASNGKMGYWENRDEIYADADCSDIKDSNGTVIGTLRNQNVRHHKFPSLNQLNSWGSPFYTPAGTAVGNQFLFFGSQSTASDWLGGNLDFNFPNYLISPYIKDASITDTSGVGTLNMAFSTDTYVDFEVKLRLQGNQSAQIEFAILNSSNVAIYRKAISIAGTVFGYQDTGEQSHFISSLHIQPGYYIRCTCSRENDLSRPTVLIRVSMIGNDFETSSTTGKVMGVRFSDINIPTAIADKITSQYFGFLQRTTNNSTKVAMTLMDEYPEGDDIDKIFRIRNFDISHTRPSVLVNYIKTDLWFNKSDVIGVTADDSLGGFTLNLTQNYQDELFAIDRAEYQPRIYFNDDGEVKTEDEFEIESVNDMRTTIAGGKLPYISMYRYLHNAYIDYSTQSVVVMGHTPIATTQTMLSGDIHINFICLIHNINQVTIKWSIFHYVLESIANVELRHGTETEMTLPRDLGLLPLGLNGGIGEEWFNFWIYNDDYTSINNIVPQSIFECTDSCDYGSNLFPVRVARSLATNNEDGVTTWRTFKEGEFYDMVEKDKGAIYRLDKYGGSLMIHQFYSLFIAQVKDTIQSSDTDLFIGRGDIFDRPPREVVMSNSSNAYAGCQSLWGALVTKHGYIFWDSVAGKIFQFKGEIKEISNDGMKFFLEDNSSTFPVGVDNPFIDQGLCLGYDEKENRLLVTRASTISADSYTLSYSFHRGQWIAFHDYTPNGYYNNRTGNFCFSNYGVNSYGNLQARVYRLDSGEKGVYFNKTIKFPSYIDVPFYIDQNFVRYMGVAWETEVFTNEFDQNKFAKVVSYDETLTQIMCYDNHRCTGLIDIVNNKNHRTDNVRRVHTLWQFNDVRDVVIDKNAIIIFKDGSINESNLKNTKIYYKKSKFIGKFMTVRFQYDNLANKDINIKTVTVAISKSER